MQFLQALEEGAPGLTFRWNCQFLRQEAQLIYVVHFLYVFSLVFLSCCCHPVSPSVRQEIPKSCSHIGCSGGWLQHSQLRLAGLASCAPSVELAFSKSPLASSLQSLSIGAGFNRTPSKTFVASAYFLADSYLYYINSTWNVRNLLSLEDHWPTGCCTRGSSRNSSF